MPELHTLTLRQFCRALREDFFAQTPGADISRAEYDRCYPIDSRLQEWVRTIVEAAQSGEAIPAVVLDSLCRSGCAGVVRSLRHDWPASLPAGYGTPEERARWAEQERNGAFAKFHPWNRRKAVRRAPADV